MPLVARTATPFELKSVKIDLPDSDRMFPRPGSGAINNNCLACHSAGMVLNQPALSKQAWTAEVNKMITAYKAPVTPEDVAAAKQTKVRSAIAAVTLQPYCDNIRARSSEWRALAIALSKVLY